MNIARIQRLRRRMLSASMLGVFCASQTLRVCSCTHSMPLALNAIRVDVDRHGRVTNPPGLFLKKRFSPAPFPKKSDPEGGYRVKQAVVPCSRKDNSGLFLKRVTENGGCEKLSTFFHNPAYPEESSPGCAHMQFRFCESEGRPFIVDTASKETNY